MQQRQPQHFARPGQSSRSSYPSFLSVYETVGLQITWAFHGFIDGSRWDKVVATVLGDSEIRANILKSLLLNSISLTSIYAFDFLLIPLVQSTGQEKWLHRNVGWFYQVLWLLPVISVSFYLNSSWCTTIAKRTYTLQYGSRSAAQPQQMVNSYTGMLKSLATSAYRVVMLFTSVVLSFALGRIPLVGWVMEFVFICWLDSYYCFEYVWIAQGLSLSRRVRHLEERWAYYFAFGLPTAALCMWGTSMANAAIFALIFPVYIIMAMHARPLPIDPYNPLPPLGDSVTRHPSPFIPIRIPIFAVVIWLNDWIVWGLSGCAGGRRAISNTGPSTGWKPPLRRRFSDAAESVEEGGGDDFTSRRTRIGIDIRRGSGPGMGRRKMD